MARPREKIDKYCGRKFDVGSKCSNQMNLLCLSFETFKTKVIGATSLNFCAGHLLIPFSEQVALMLKRSIECYEMVVGKKENIAKNYFAKF